MLSLASLRNYQQRIFVNCVLAKEARKYCKEILSLWIVTYSHPLTGGVYNLVVVVTDQ